MSETRDTTFLHSERDDSVVYCRQCGHKWVQTDVSGVTVECPECSENTSTHTPNWRYKGKIVHGDQCLECGCHGRIHIHHVDTDHDNESEENLIPLCGTCHGIVHNGDPSSELLQELKAQLPECADTK